MSVDMAYRIRSIVEKTGIPRNTLLAWERRYGVPTPGRTPGGHRVYSEADLALLRRLQDLLQQGHRIGEAVGLLRKNAEPERARSDGAPIDQQRKELFDALMAFDRTRADEAYHRLSSHALRRVIDHVLLPLLRDVGEGWHRGEVSIAQEHFATVFVREQLITMLNRLESGPPGGPIAVCAGYPGETHEIGLLAVAVKLALRGWRVAYLGVDLPIEELAELLSTRNAELICQSLMVPRDRDELHDYTRRLLRLCPPDTFIGLGGPGVADLQDLSEGRLLLTPSFKTLLAEVDAHRRR